MCKLCNSDEPPYLPKLRYKETPTSIAREILESYTGEKPCPSAINTVRCGMRNGRDIDSIVIERLFSVYCTKIHGITKVNSIKHNTLYKKESRQRRDKYNADNIELITIEKHIKKRVNKKVGSTSFMGIRYKGVGNTKSKTFKTIEEAREYRDKIKGLT